MPPTALASHPQLNEVTPAGAPSAARPNGFIWAQPFLETHPTAPRLVVSACGSGLSEMSRTDGRPAAGRGHPRRTRALPDRAGRWRLEIWTACVLIRQMPTHC